MGEGPDLPTGRDIWRHVPTLSIYKGPCRGGGVAGCRYYHCSNLFFESLPLQISLLIDALLCLASAAAAAKRQCAVRYKNHRLLRLTTDAVLAAMENVSALSSDVWNNVTTLQPDDLTSYLANIRDLALKVIYMTLTLRSRSSTSSSELSASLTTCLCSSSSSCSSRSPKRFGETSLTPLKRSGKVGSQAYWELCTLSLSYGRSKTGIKCMLCFDIGNFYS